MLRAVDRRPPRAGRRRPRRRERRRARSRRSTTAAISTPARSSCSVDRRGPRASAATTTARSPGLIAQSSTRRRDRRRQHHADEVVAGEDERLLDRAGRDDDPLGADPVEHVAGVDRARARPRRSPSARAGASTSYAVAAAAAALVDEEHAAALRRRGRGGRAAGAAAADHEHVDAPVLGVVAARVPAALGDAAETGDVAQEALVERPRPARPDHRAVVEADRRERAADLVDDARAGRGRASRARSARATSAPSRTRLDADADVRHAVDRHHAVRAAARAAEQPARPVVLEAAREDAPARRRRAPSRSCRPRTPSTGLPSNVNVTRRRAVDPLARLGRQRIRRPTVRVGARDLGAREPRSCACRARRRTRGRSRRGGTTTRAARRRRCRGSRRSR